MLAKVVLDKTPIILTFGLAKRKLTFVYAVLFLMV
jgi:hypothetical protein